MFAPTRWYRAIRYGQPVVVVSGLPRSGTSMMMRMLEAGGVPVATDGIRRADASNPHGYFEDERVKDLDKGGDASWVRSQRGRCLKVVTYLLRHLPDTNNYLVVFMRRDMRQVLASQNAMLAARGAAESAGADGDDRMAASFRSHLADTERLLAARACFRVLYVEHAEVIRRPLQQAQVVARFLGRPLDAAAMAAAVDPSLHHHR